MPILTDAERLGTLVAAKYRLETILGRGGMGIVFAGTHTWTGRKVAVKLLKPEYASDPVIAKRFLQEAQTATKIRHPNVVDVLDMGADTDGTVYLVLDYLEGETLASILAQRGGKLDPEETLEYLLPVMGALAMAHDKGVIHRDLKPENIFVSRDSTGKTTTKLLDFGIAKVLEGRQDEATRTGQVIGTPHYMSPEQALAAPDIGTQTDVWSMGVVLFECLAGRCPFEGQTATAILLAVTGGKPKLLRDVAPDVPPKLAKAIEGALVANRAERYKNVRELVSAIAASLAGTPLAMTLLRLATEVSTFRGSASGTDPHAATLSGSGEVGPTPTGAPRPARKTPFSIANTFLGDRDQRAPRKWLAIGISGVVLLAASIGVLVAVGGDGAPTADVPTRAATGRGVSTPAATLRAPAQPPTQPTSPAPTATRTTPTTPATPATPVAPTAPPPPADTDVAAQADPAPASTRAAGGATRPSRAATTRTSATAAPATPATNAGARGDSRATRTSTTTPAAQPDRPPRRDGDGTPPALQRNW